MSQHDFITWLLIIVGWLVVHFTTLKRERRKENREAALKIVEEIKILEGMAVRFHSSEKFVHQDCDSLIWQINRIIRKLQRPPLKYLHIRIELMTRFRQNLTQNTDISTFSTQAHDGEVILNIHEITDELIDEIEAGRDIYFS